MMASDYLKLSFYRLAGQCKSWHRREMKLRALCLALSAPLSVQPVLAMTLSGSAEVVDGDTLAIRGEKTCIWLYGINSPEGQQTC